MKIFHNADLAAIEFTKEADIRKFTKGQVSGYEPRACVQGSDAHCLSDIGRRSTFLKMDGISLRGIEQALLDHEIRIKFDWEAPEEPSYPRVLSMQANQGFFEGERFEFHESLNCFVGGKGVGKSTVIEFLRYGFGDISSISDISSDTNGKVSALLGEGGVISIEYLDSDGDHKTIEAEFSEDRTRRTIRDSENNPTDLLSPPVFFSQGELTRIASTPLAQMELLDRYLDLSDESSKEQASAEKLRANADKLQRLLDQEKQLADEVDNAETGFATSRSTYDALEKALKNPVLTEFPKWESEERYPNGIDLALETLAANFDAVVDSLDIVNQFADKLADDSPNYEVFQFVSEAAISIVAKAESAKTDFRAEIEAKRSDISEVLSVWKTELASKRVQYEATLAGLGKESIRKAQSRLRNLRGRLDELKEKDQRRKHVSAQLAQLQEERQVLQGQLAESRQSRYQKRQKKVSEWQASFQDKIQLQVAQSANRSDYFEQLKSLLKGSRLRDTDLDSVVNTVLPSDLVAMTFGSDSASLASKTMLRTDLCQKLILALQAHEARDILELETTAVEDSLQIKYAVESGRYKGLNELSVGGKGTVILSLALIEGDAPLIIDQPEEPLDTLAIHEQIVCTLRKQKESRQFILTTHNANVAVGGDADLNYVLEASADQGSVKSSGGVDREETNRLLVHHLEGGIRAFDLRNRKYMR